MIRKLFIDYDETLIHTCLRAPNQEHIVFEIDGDPYFTIVRPCAKRLIDFSRSLLGEENVFILTTSTREYANHVNRLALFGFDPARIWPREDIRGSYCPTAYGGECMVPHKFADPENALIDNLPPYDNTAKTELIGISRNTDERYFQCRDYYGADFPNDPFEEDVKEWMVRLHDYRPIDE